MLNDFQNEKNNSNNYKAACACARYNIKVSCAEKIYVHGIVTEDCDGLSILPGTVSDDNGCLSNATDIIIPPCVSGMTERLPVRLEKTCQTICVTSGENPQQTAGCNGCASNCIWTGTAKHSTVSSARVGDTVTYTVTFTNHSLMTLDMVRIFDDVPSGAAVVPGSIRPAPRPGETLQTGISMGSIAAGHSVTLEYSVTVEPGASGRLINYAHAEYCYKDCQGCCRHGVGSRRSCAVKIIPCDIRIAVIKSADKRSVCSMCEKITYTVIVSNTGGSVLTDVTAYDSIPPGLCYMSHSTRRNDGAPTDENPQDGIFIGSLNPGESYVVTFILVVCARPRCDGTPVEFVNTACARGFSGKTMVSAESDPWIIEMNGKRLYQCIQKRFPIGDFCCLRDCFVYHTDVNCFNTTLGYAVSYGYGIAVKYVDCNGEKKSKSFEGRVIFLLPEEITGFTVQFTDLICRNDCCGNIFAGFKATLCYCENP